MAEGNEILFLVHELPEGGYETRALGESIFTEADTLEDLRVMMRDAVECHFEESERPAVIRDQMGWGKMDCRLPRPA